MNSASPGNKRQAFTLVEVIVATVILAIGIVSLVGALGGLTRAERAVSDKELITRIANDKLQELIATEAWQSEAGGSFDDPNLDDFTWSLEEVNVGIENLTGLNLTVDSSNRGEVTVSTIVFTPPETTGEGT